MRTVRPTSPHSARASRTVFILGAIGVVSVGLRLVLETVRASDECPSFFTGAIEFLVWAGILSAALTLVIGIVALVSGANRPLWTVLGMSLAVAVGVSMFIPNVATITCGAA